MVLKSQPVEQTVSLAGASTAAGIGGTVIAAFSVGDGVGSAVGELVGGGVGVAIGYVRGLNAMLASPTRQSRPDQAHPAWLATIFLVALGTLSIGLAIYPDPLLQAARRLLAAYPLPPL